MKNIALCFLVIILSACATISHGPIEEVSFSSETDSVDVLINEKHIGQMPVSADLWKIKTQDVTFIMQDEYKFYYTLKTKPSVEMLKNIVFCYPLIPVGLAMVGIDAIGRSGFDFKEVTVQFKTFGADTLLSVKISTKRKKPTEYILVSSGLAQCSFDVEEEGHENYSRVNIPELAVEFTRTFREIYHIGYGINVQWEQDLGNDDSIIILPAYLFVKAAPIPQIAGFRGYGIFHAGFVYSRGMEDGAIRFNLFPDLYSAYGLGLSYKDKIYTEVLWRKVPDIRTLEQMDLNSVVLRVGVRFEL
ncbi:MAG: hypothetical protein JW794_04975 [Candidatus Cloacimonetes bacterium]|nr:hypothetical protein [Candidatus Cloacimonadota bacterium]